MNDKFEPKTPLGKKLVELKEAYINAGGKLVNEEEFDKLLKELRAGSDDTSLKDTKKETN